MRLSPSLQATGAAISLALSLSACAAMLDRLEGDKNALAVVADTACPALVETTAVWATSVEPEPFAVPAIPAGLEQRVELWKRIWGRLTARQHLVVDSDRPWLVWAEVDCRGINDDVCAQHVHDSKDAVAARLATVDADLLAAYDGDADLAQSADERVIAIHGRRIALKQARARAALELHEIESLFAAAGVPRAFARVAFLESGWQDDAVSAKGAAGLFQFTGATATALLQVDDDVDERRDHRRAAVAAATYLKALRDQLGSWPLALTAYNTGPTRLQSVLRSRNTRDLAVIAAAGDLDGFGFEGQNYFAQVAAIISLTADDVLVVNHQAGRAVTLREPASLQALSTCFDVDPVALAVANPALAEAVVVGERDVPAAHVVWVPGRDDGARLAQR